MREKLIIVGLGSTARHILNFVNHYQLYDVIGFAVNQEYMITTDFMGLPVYALETLQHTLRGENFKLFVSVMWNHLNRDRKILYLYCKSHGFQMANIISPTAVVRSTIESDNLFIDDYVVIANDVRIGNNCYFKVSSVCGPNVKIYDHCFFAIKSLIGGGCIIGEQCFIGFNATIFDATIIGKKCLIGACTNVKRNMPDFSRIVTTSDFIIKQYAENEIEEKLVASKNVR